MPDSKYRILERVAAGGMAEVYRGVAESLQGFRKNVAIKRVLPSLTKNRKFVAMFLDEARLSLHLQHANIVQVFDIGHADETYFIVMEFVDGVDMKLLVEWRRRIGRRLTIGQTVYIIMEVCKGLAYAHEATHPETGEPLGIVHRDVSPPNVMLSRNGEVKVADFGLAKAADQLEDTDPGVVKGKMSYLSPEAARGEDVDSRADIFAVGILMYEMLTGKRLFYGETDYQTVELVRAAKIPPIAPQNPEVEAELEEICRKALAKRTDDRFQTATDLQDALAHYLFSRGLKMIQRDIADLVRSCLEDIATTSGAAQKQQKANVIDTLLHEEIVAFTSMDFQDPNPPEDGEGRTTAGDAPPPGGDFIDPRAWANDADWPRRTAGRSADGLQQLGSNSPAPLVQPPPPAAPGLLRQTIPPVAPGGPKQSNAGRPSPVQPRPAATPSQPHASQPSAATPSPVGTQLGGVPQAAFAGGAQQSIPFAQATRGPGRVFIIGVLLGCLALGAALAALLFRS